MAVRRKKLKLVRKDRLTGEHLVDPAGSTSVKRSPKPWMLVVLVLVAIGVGALVRVLQNSGAPIAVANSLWSGKNVWDWLDFLAKAATPIILVLGGLWANKVWGRESQKRLAQQKATETQRLEQERTIAQDHGYQVALKDYLDQMTQLLLSDVWLLTTDRSDTADNPEKELRLVAMARARTLAVLRELDATRKGSVIRFLFESEALPHISLASANLEAANLSGACLDQTNLCKANLNGANLSWARLNQAVLCNANLSGTNLYNANLNGANLCEAYLREADLSRASLCDAYLDSANFSGAKLINAYLSGTKLIGADLSRAQLMGADLSGAKLIGADLSNADLSGADLSGTKLIWANLRGTNLSKANLRRANLSNADLSGANLEGTDLSKANLRRANLSNADLRGADLSNALILGTDFREVKHLTPKQFAPPDRPFLCKVALPSYLKNAGVDADCDCGRIPRLFCVRYPADFPSLNKAQEYADRIQRPGGE